MKLESQVTSLELSKRLKELGVKQESYFWWNIVDEKLYSGREIEVFATDGYVEGDVLWLSNFISAFTVAELGETLPSEIEVEETEYYLRCSRGLRDYWEIAYCNSKYCYMPMTCENEAEVRGLMLEYLITNGLYH